MLSSYRNFLNTFDSFHLLVFGAFLKFCFTCCKPRFDLSINVKIVPFDFLKLIFLVGKWYPTHLFITCMISVFVSSNQFIASVLVRTWVLGWCFIEIFHEIQIQFSFLTLNTSVVVHCKYKPIITTSLNSYFH